MKQMSILKLLLVLVCTSSYSFAEEHNEHAMPPNEIQQSQGVAVGNTSAVKAMPQKDWSYDEESNVSFGRGLASVPAVKQQAAHEEKINDFPAEKALDFLKNGNLRFVQGKLRKSMEGMNEKDRNRLLAGQSPHTIVLSCSDSRVPPEYVFDQRLGEIFVIRSAGESLDKSVIASIEYAVSHLGVQLIFVMGHESCGAVQAALQTMPNTSAGSPSLDYLVADIQPRISSYFRQPASSGVIRESTANARGVARDLIERSAIVKKRVAEGKLQVRTGLYHMDSGMVDFH